MIRDAIRRVVGGESLSREEAAGAVGEIVEGRATPAQIGALLVALRMRGETVDEIVGCAAAIRARSVRVRCDDPRAIDTCGTGGDGAGTFNVSTAAAFVAAAGGVTVAKHGNHGVSSACGSADVLAAAGLDLTAPRARLERSLASCGIAFLYAPLHHPAVRHAASPRREIGLRTIFNATGPLTNPALVRRQVLGVYDRRLVEPVAAALRELGAERALVVHGEGGLDEISCAGPTLAAELEDGTIRLRTIVPEDAGLRRRPVESIRGGGLEENLGLLLDVLSGRAPEAYRDAVALNAAAAFVVGGVVPDLLAGAARALGVIASGAARHVLERAVAISREDGA